MFVNLTARSLALSLVHLIIRLAVLLIRVNFAIRLFYTVFFFQISFYPCEQEHILNKKIRYSRLQTEGKKEDNSAGKMRNGSLFVLQNDDDGDEHHLSNKMRNSERQLEEGTCKMEVNMKNVIICVLENEMRKKERERAS